MIGYITKKGKSGDTDIRHAIFKKLDEIQAVG